MLIDIHPLKLIAHDRDGDPYCVVCGSMSFGKERAIKHESDCALGQYLKEEERKLIGSYTAWLSATNYPLEQVTVRTRIESDLERIANKTMDVIRSDGSTLNIVKDLVHDDKEKARTVLISYLEQARKMARGKVRELDDQIRRVAAL